MRINPVSSTPSFLNFKSNVVDFYNAQNQAKNSTKDNKIVVGIIGLSIIGAASAATAILKKRNTTPAEIVKKSVNGIQKKYIHNRKIKPDPVCIILDGKRDKEAVRIYKAYCARTKLQSLERRFADGEFLGLGRPLDDINYNKSILQRVSKNVI